MKNYVNYIFSFIAFCIAMLLPSIAIGFNHIVKWLVLCAIIIIVGGLAISLTLTVWSNKPKKSAFFNSLKISFGLSAVVFIIGYIFTAIHPILF